MPEFGRTKKGARPAGTGNRGRGSGIRVRHPGFVRGYGAGANPVTVTVSDTVTVTVTVSDPRTVSKLPCRKEWAEDRADRTSGGGARVQGEDAMSAESKAVVRDTGRAAAGFFFGIALVVATYVAAST